MTWSTERIQDRDGHWVHVVRDFDVVERLGPFDDEDAAMREEILTRMRIRLAHGASAFSS